MKNSIGPIIGMLHVPALPGSPQNLLPFTAIVDWVLKDARTMASEGVDALMLENFGDTPFFPNRVPPHTIAFLTAIACEVKSACSVPLGINVLRNDAEGALAIASAVSAVFIRVNIHSGARLTDQGVIEGKAHETLRYRKLLGINVAILADVDVKHSAPLAARPLEEEVEEVVSRGGADAVIVTGTATGRQTPAEDLITARQAAAGVPVIAGSGVNGGNVATILKIADGVIIGTSLKRDGITTNPVDPQRLKEFMKAVRR